MSFIFTLIWGVVLGNVVGYVVGAMTAYTYDASTATLSGVFIAVLVVMIAAIMGGQEPSGSHH